MTAYTIGQRDIDALEVAITTALTAARREGIEAAAKVADEVGARDDDPHYDEVPWQTVAINIAAAIRRLL